MQKGGEGGYDTNGDCTCSERNQGEGMGLLRSMTTHLERKNDGVGDDERKRRQCRHR